MTRNRIATTLLVAGMLCGCGDSTGTGVSGVTAKANDPTGDTYGVGSLLWDLTALSITGDSTGLTVKLDFSNNLIAPTSGDSNAMIGFVDLDTDEDSTTGFVSTVDQFRPNSGSTGMGPDFELDLASYAADSTVTVFNSLGNPMGQVRPVFKGKRVTIRIPAALIGGDDGALNAAAIVGTLATPTDIVPEFGHLHLDAVGALMQPSMGPTAMPAGSLRRLTRKTWGSR
jgi:hypothetical protein